MNETEKQIKKDEEHRTERVRQDAEMTTHSEEQE